MLDVAQLDDLSSIAFLTLLLAIAPILNGNGHSISAEEVGMIIAKFAVTLIGFIIFCIILAKKVIPHIKMLKKNVHEETMLVISIGLIIAALSSFLGLSIAVGAFFSGLIFSRNVEAVKCHSCYIPLYDFFIPFFFIVIGLNIDPALLSDYWMVGLILLAAAIIGKIVGTGVAALPSMGLSGAMVIGILFLVGGRCFVDMGVART